MKKITTDDAKSIGENKAYLPSDMMERVAIRMKQFEVAAELRK